MVVQHNLTAMNSNRMLGLTTASQAKSTEKLSSGYKINRAADDAAGLSISEKMRKQIRGLTQASLNAQDGISAVQTAEGALTEVHDMLQRMNELAVKAGNGTMSADDRNYVQNEIDQLVNEIDRVSETTKFNETYLLKGDATANGNQKTFAAGAVLGTVDGVTVAAKGNTEATLIPIWLLRWLSTPTTTSWLRQVRLCWLSPIRLTRAYCLCYSKLKLRSGCFLRGTNHICKSYVRTKGQSMTGCPFWVLIRPFDHPKISFPIPSKNYHSNPWLPV